MSLKQPLFVIVFVVFIQQFYLQIVWLPQRHVFVFHGIGRSCSYLKDENFLQEEDICLETGSYYSSTDNLIEQANNACKQIENYISASVIKQEFIQGFHLKGFSQGGLIARLVFQRCLKIKSYIRTIVTIGTPNIGISNLIFPKETLVQKIFHWLVDDKIQQAKENPNANYDTSYQQFTNGKDGQFSKFIQELIDPQYQDYSNLNYMVNVMFLQENLVLPMESSLFGVRYDFNSFNFYNYEYLFSLPNKQLGKLAYYNRLLSCVTSGQHLKLTPQAINQLRIFTTDYCQIDKYYIYHKDLQTIKLTYDQCQQQTIQNKGQEQQNPSSVNWILCDYPSKTIQLNPNLMYKGIPPTLPTTLYSWYLPRRIMIQN